MFSGSSRTVLIRLCHLLAPEEQNIYPALGEAGKEDVAHVRRGKPGVADSPGPLWCSES